LVTGAFVCESVMRIPRASVVALETDTWVNEHLQESSGQFPLAQASAHHL